MTIRTIALAVAAIGALSPVISGATPATSSARACANAFATSIAAPGAAAPAYKFAYRGNVGSSLSDFYSTEYTFTLEARDPKTGVAIARARCSTNARGDVTAISAVPLDATPAVLAERN